MGKNLIRGLGFKRDFARTLQRFEGWWQRELIDRPPVTVSVRPSRPCSPPERSHLTLHQKWMDVQFVVDSAIADLARRDYVADTLPVFWPNLGPEITGTLFGCELEFSEGTSWSRPIVHDVSEWPRIEKLRPDFDNAYWRTIERMTDYALQACEGRFLVGITDLHGNYDILASLRDPQELCLDLMDDPDAVRRAGAHVSAAFADAFSRSYAKVAAAGQPSIAWIPAPHAGPAYIPSCDFWCMVSPRIARDLILPDIVTEMEPLERSIFHLDGPDALQHLELLLELPRLDAVQWVYGAGRGPAARWMDVYRRILGAGKSVMLLAQDPADALAVLSEVGPRGLFISVEQRFDTVGEAESFVRDVERLSLGRPKG